MNITTGPPLGLAFFFFNDTATTEIYTLSLHDALPIYSPSPRFVRPELDSSAQARFALGRLVFFELNPEYAPRSEEHTSELQSQSNLVCRLLLEKKINRAIVQPIPAALSRQPVVYLLLL